MKRILILALFGLSTLAFAQTAPLSLPGVTITVPMSDLTSLLAVQGPPGPQGLPGQSIQGPAGPQGLPGKDAICPTTTAQSYTDMLFSMSTPQALDTTSGSGVFATSFSIPANTLKAGVLRIHAGGTWALGATGAWQRYGIEIDGQPLLPAVGAWMNGSTAQVPDNGYWRITADVELSGVGNPLNASTLGTVGIDSSLGVNGSNMTIDPTKAHVITIYSSDDLSDTGDTATMTQFWLALN